MSITYVSEGDAATPSNMNTWLTVASGDAYNVTSDDFGAAGDGTTDDTAAFTSAISSNRVVYIPPGTYLLSNLSFTGVSNLILRGSGPGTILDFAGVTSGDGLTFTYDSGSGGCKYITIENLTITDSSASSNVARMMVFEGGTTGQSPSQTSAFVTLRNIKFLKHANASGDGLVIDGLSNVFCDSVTQDGYGVGEGLVLLNTANVNTGIFSFINCVFRGAVRAMRVAPSGTLMDSAFFGSCFFGNTNVATALDTVLFEGTQAIAAFAFYGCHLENRHASLDMAVSVTGAVYAMSWVSCHLSCGTASNQNQYGFRFTGATVKGCYFGANEFLRLQTRSTGGRCFYFDNDCTLDPYEPVEIGPIWRNVNTPVSAEVESGSPDDNFKAVLFRPNTVDQNVVGGLDKIYTFGTADGTPSVKYGRTFLTGDTGTLTGFDEGHEGQVITIIAAHSMTINDSASIDLNGGANFTMAAGDTLTLVLDDGLIWKEIGRSDNTP